MTVKVLLSSNIICFKYSWQQVTIMEQSIYIHVSVCENKRIIYFKFLHSYSQIRQIPIDRHPWITNHHASHHADSGGPCDQVEHARCGGVVQELVSRDLLHRRRSSGEH